MEVQVRVPNINKARSILDFEPKINIDDGLYRTIEWIETHILEGNNGIR